MSSNIFNLSSAKVFCQIRSPQTADSLGRTLDNLGKDIRTITSGVAGVGDSAEVYAIGRTATAKERLAQIVWREKNFS